MLLETPDLATVVWIVAAGVCGYMLGWVRCRAAHRQHIGQVAQSRKER